MTTVVQKSWNRRLIMPNKTTLKLTSTSSRPTLMPLLGPEVQHKLRTLIQGLSSNSLSPPIGSFLPRSITSSSSSRKLHSKTEKTLKMIAMTLVSPIQAHRWWTTWVEFKSPFKITSSSSRWSLLKKDQSVEMLTAATIKPRSNSMVTRKAVREIGRSSRQATTIWTWSKTMNMNLKKIWRSSSLPLSMVLISTK